MHARLTLATMSLLGGVLLTPSPGRAADPPTPAQLIESLAPSPATPPATRGIRLGDAETKTAPQGSVSLNIPFGNNSSAITPEAAKVLDALADAFADAKLAESKFRVEGHTDTVGSPEANQSLSERRAASVVDYLTAKRHVASSRLTAAGVGQDGLLVATGPGVREPRNRRVLVVNTGH